MSQEIYDLEEVIEISEIIYKKKFTSKNDFNKLIKKEIISAGNTTYFLTHSLNLGKYIKNKDEFEFLVFSYTNSILENYNYEFENKSIKSGFDILDKRITMTKGQFVIIASRPSIGKSSFLTQLCYNQAKNNFNVGFYSFESSREDIIFKILAFKTSIPLTNIIKNNMDIKELSNLSTASDDLNSKKILIDTKSYNLKALIKKIKIDFIIHKLDIVYIDYLQLIKSMSYEENRYLELNQISRELKILAKELNILIISTSELNRGLENRLDKRPMLIDLRDSGTLEDDADIIMFIYRDDVYKQRDEARKEKEAKDKGEDYKSKFIDKPIEEAEIIIGKQRNGPIGTVKLDFHKALTKFIDKANEHYGNAPIEVVFQSVADTQKETKIDFPDGVL